MSDKVRLIPLRNPVQTMGKRFEIKVARGITPRAAKELMETGKGIMHPDGTFELIAQPLRKIGDKPIMPMGPRAVNQSLAPKITPRFLGAGQFESKRSLH